MLATFFMLVTLYQNDASKSWLINKSFIFQFYLSRFIYRMLSRVVAQKKWKFIPYLSVCRARVTITSKDPLDVSRSKYVEEKSFFASSKVGKTPMTDVLAALHRTWTIPAIKDFFKKKNMTKLRECQRYIDERHKVLLPDLATTHFITYRGGKVKFQGKDEWMIYDHIIDDIIPSKYEPGFTLEEIDASDTHLCYEGFENFVYLRGLKKLFLRNCPYVDDFCLRRLFIFEHTLEYLDLSGCENITERGISTLYFLKHLKTLVIHDTPNVLNKELVCLLLQDELPNLKIEGVDFDNPLLLKKLKAYMN